MLNSINSIKTKFNKVIFLNNRILAETKSLKFFNGKYKFNNNNN